MSKKWHFVHQAEANEQRARETESARERRIDEERRRLEIIIKPIGLPVCLDGYKLQWLLRQNNAGYC